MKIDVIGGSGFIGTRLCSLLNDLGAKFSITDKLSSAQFPNSVNIADVRSLIALRSVISDSNMIINLAAEHRDDVTPRSLYTEVNVGGAKNICQLAREIGVNKIIFISSVAIYGFAEPDADELSEIRPFNDYGLTKWQAEKIFQDWQKEDESKRSLVIIRPTVVFGEGNRGNVYNLFRQIASGRFVMVGNGENRKSMAYVQNIAEFIIYCINFGPGCHIYNYADKPDFSMNELVLCVDRLLNKTKSLELRLPYKLGLFIGSFFDLLSKLTSKKYPISRVRIKKFCANSTYKNSSSPQGFVPSVSLVDGIKRTLNHDFNN